MPRPVAGWLLLVPTVVAWCPDRHDEEPSATGSRLRGRFHMRRRPSSQGRSPSGLPRPSRQAAGRTMPRMPTVSLQSALRTIAANCFQDRAVRLRHRRAGFCFLSAFRWRTRRPRWDCRSSRSAACSALRSCRPRTGRRSFMTWRSASGWGRRSRSSLCSRSRHIFRDAPARFAACRFLRAFRRRHRVGRHVGGLWAVVLILEAVK